MKLFMMIAAVVISAVCVAGCKKDNNVAPVKATTFHAEVRSNPDSLSGGQEPVKPPQ